MYIKRRGNGSDVLTINPRKKIMLAVLRAVVVMLRVKVRHARTLAAVSPTIGWKKTRIV